MIGFRAKNRNSVLVLLAQVNHTSFMIFIFLAIPCLMLGDFVVRENGGTFLPGREVDNAASVKE